MRSSHLLWLLVMVFTLGQTYIILVQGSTIRGQQKIIRQMIKNPNCLIP